MLYNLVYNRDCMIHEIVCETGSGAPYEVTKKVMEDFFGEGCYDKAKAYTPSTRTRQSWPPTASTIRTSTTLPPSATGCGP